jgi:hypothetical protein
MATVTLTYSQALVDKAHELGIRPVSDEFVELHELPATFSALSQMAALAGRSGVGGVAAGSSLQIASPAGALTFGGMSYTATLGTAHSLSVEVPGLLSMQQQGDYTMILAQSGNTKVVQAVLTTITAGDLHATPPPGDPDYDPLVGNVRGSMIGAVKTDSDGNISGTVARLSASADSFLKSSLMEGNFNVSGVNGIFGGESYSKIFGTLNNFRNEYADGSVEAIEGVSVYYTTEYRQDLLGSYINFGGDDVFNVSLPARLYDSLDLYAGDGNDVLTLSGGGGRLYVNAGKGNDTITLRGDSQSVGGGDGVDTVRLAGARGDYTKGVNALSVTYKDRNGVVATLTDVERVEFSDSGIAYDIKGNAGQAYRIYKAAFDRAPDAEGLGFWIDTLDRGQTLAQVASGFLSSPEYIDSYGAGISDKAFINHLYHNVLHRDADADGASYWDGRIANGASRAQVLVEFSESRENQAQVIGAIQNGIDYLPF